VTRGVERYREHDEAVPSLMRLSPRRAVIHDVGSFRPNAALRSCRARAAGTRMVS
jgi:hypothetical protein